MPEISYIVCSSFLSMVAISTTPTSHTHLDGVHWCASLQVLSFKCCSYVILWTSFCMVKWMKCFSLDTCWSFNGLPWFRSALSQHVSLSQFWFPIGLLCGNVILLSPTPARNSDDAGAYVYTCMCLCNVDNPWYPISEQTTAVSKPQLLVKIQLQDVPIKGHKELSWNQLMTSAYHRVVLLCLAPAWPLRPQALVIVCTLVLVPSIYLQWIHLMNLVQSKLSISNLRWCHKVQVAVPQFAWRASL